LFTAEAAENAEALLGSKKTSLRSLRLIDLHCQLNTAY